jgi:hypothetical protein
MPLKFVNTNTETENENVNVENITQGQYVENNPYIPDSITNYEGNGQATGFSLSFTDGFEYNLDEIIDNIRRDNPDNPLLVYVIEEESETEVVLQTAVAQLLLQYSTNSLQSIPNYADLLALRFQDLMVESEIIENDNAKEGTLTLNETQPGISVTKADMLKYLLDDSAPKRAKPVVDYSRPLVLITEATVDLNINDDFEYFENLGNVILDLQADIDANDGGDFEILDLDGGSFTENIIEIEDGGAF